MYALSLLVCAQKLNTVLSAGVAATISNKTRHALSQPAGKEKSKEAEGAVMRQMEAIQEAIQQAVQEGRSSIRDPGHVPEHVARHFMRDPLGMILSSQGVPMGISLKVDPQKLPQHRRR